MKQFSDFPRVSLGILPTPLYRLPNISEAMGKNIYIKRDDMTGVALGGNKVRKLEFLIADAMAQGCDYMLTTGGAQSNHAMLTAACCDRLGLGSVLVLKKRGVWQKLGNQIINDLLGADVRFVDTDDYADVYAEMERICGELRAKGHKPYCVPVGGSVPVGSLGYVNAAREAIEQGAALGVRFDDIICCTGSGGTHAGMDLGARIYSPKTRVTGIAVDDERFRPIVRDLVNETSRLLEAGIHVEESDINVFENFIGRCRDAHDGKQGGHNNRSGIHRQDLRRAYKAQPAGLFRWQGQYTVPAFRRRWRPVRNRHRPYGGLSAALSRRYKKDGLSRPFRVSKKWLNATFLSFLIRCLRLWRGQHLMQGKPCYASAFCGFAAHVAKSE